MFGQQAVVEPEVVPHAWHFAPEHVVPFAHDPPETTHRFVLGSQQPASRQATPKVQQGPPATPHGPASAASVPESEIASGGASRGASGGASAPTSA
jgi:hypothetical protein